MGDELRPTINLSPAVTLDAYGARLVIERLITSQDLAARILARRVQKAWRWRKEPYITLRLTRNELEMVKESGGIVPPSVVDSYRYLAVYRHPRTGQEVRVRSVDRPPKKRSFKSRSSTGRVGRRKFKRVRLYRKRPKESAKVAKKSKKAKKAVDEDLEGLEELEELEDEDAEEPDDEDEDTDDEDDEDEAPPKKKSKSKKKGKSKKASAKKRKKKVVVEDEEDDEDEDEDEEDDDEDEAPKKRKRSKKESKKAKSKDKSKKGGVAGKTTKEATGGVGSAELAAAASEIAEVEIDGRDVRVYLRKNEIPKDEEHGRYVWPSEKNKEFKKLAKAIAAEYEDEDDDE